MRSSTRSSITKLQKLLGHSIQKIIAGDSTNAKRAEAADKAYAAFVGSVENIERVQEYLEMGSTLPKVQVRQLNKILYAAAGQPQTIKDVVDRRIAAETKQTEALFGYDYRLFDKSVTTNFIDSILTHSTDEATRLKAWQESKEVGQST